jgi:hypothetical protein
LVILSKEKITAPPIAYRILSWRGRGYTLGKSLRLTQHKLTTTYSLPLFQTIKVGEAAAEQ